MLCPFCGFNDTKVLESRDSEETTRRRRECLKCLKRFTTYEKVYTSNIIVIKKDGKKEPFNRDKLMKGFLKACTKRPVTMKEVETKIDSIEQELKRMPSPEVASRKLGLIVMRKLKSLDKVAYVRYASVYMNFKDPITFNDFIKKVL